MLPSLLSINKHYQLPKVHFLFFEFLLKVAIGNATWKKRLKEEETRLATQGIEAYANAVVNNHYFAFLYIYFMNNLNSTLCTEYNEEPQLTQTCRATNMTSTSMHNLFCTDLDFIEVSVPGAAATGGDAITQEQDDFKLLSPPPNKEDEESDDEGKSTREHDEAVAKEIKDLIDRDQPGGNGDGTSRLSYFLKMKSKFEEDWWALLSANTLLYKKRAQQESQASKVSLREFTKVSRKSKKHSDIIMGWTSQGKQYKL
jgi:hypothetical protein